MAEIEDEGTKWLSVPCAECFAHTGERCHAVGVVTERSTAHFEKGHVHVERKAQARRAMQRPL